MKKIIIASLFSLGFLSGYSQQLLTLEECCNIAVENNKQGKLSDFSIQKAQLQVKNMNSNFCPSCRLWVVIFMRIKILVQN